MCIPDIYNARVIDDCSLMQLDIESLTIFCKISSTPYVICSIYRLPAGVMAVFLRELNNILLKLTTRHKPTKCFIVGDFNINLLRTASGSSPLNYVTTMFSYGYIPLIERPTRVTDHSATLIDHIWMNDCSVVRNRGILDLALQIIFLCLPQYTKTLQLYWTKRCYTQKGCLTE